MLSNSHVLVTGANGYIGKSLCTSLLEKNAHVSAIINLSNHNKIVNDNISYYSLNLLNSPETKELFSCLNPEYVIHLAGIKDRSLDVSIFEKQYAQNISISLSVIRACLGILNLKRIIFIGSCEEYGNTALPYNETNKEVPTSAYGLSKLAITQIVSSFFLNNNFPSIILRPSVIYGPGQGAEMFLPALVQNLLSGKIFPMTKGEQQRDFIYIDDIVNAIIKAMVADKEVNGMTINIGFGASYKIRNIVKIVAGIIGGESFNRVDFGHYDYRKNEVMNYSVDISRANELLQWKPETNLKEGLIQTISYFKKNK